MLEGVRRVSIGHVGHVEELSFGREVKQVLNNAGGRAEICTRW